MSTAIRISLLCLGAMVSGYANGAEYPAGAPHIIAGMEVAAVYLQPVEMDPPEMMMAAKEADIHATADNWNGFAEGDWLPNLHVEYVLTKLDSGDEFSGAMMPMVASDGPHYGDNVKLAGITEALLLMLAAALVMTGVDRLAGWVFCHHRGLRFGTPPPFLMMEVPWGTLFPR